MEWMKIEELEHVKESIKELKYYKGGMIEK